MPSLSPGFFTTSLDFGGCFLVFMKKLMACSIQTISYPTEYLQNWPYVPVLRPIKLNITPFPSPSSLSLQFTRRLGLYAAVVLKFSPPPRRALHPRASTRGKPECNNND